MSRTIRSRLISGNGLIVKMAVIILKIVRIFTKRTRWV